MTRTFEFEQVRLIIISAFSSLLAILTPTEGFVVALIIGFGFNIFCGMRADGISITRCKNFSWNKAQKANSALYSFSRASFSSFSFFFSSFVNGTGSYAILCNGLHLKSLHRVNALAFTKLNFS